MKEWNRDTLELEVALDTVSSGPLFTEDQTEDQGYNLSEAIQLVGKRAESFSLHFRHVRHLINTD